MSSIFGRFSIFLFSLLFPFLLFVTMFRYSSGLNNVYGFYDFFNQLQYTSHIDLERDVNNIITQLNAFTTFVDIFTESTGFDTGIYDAIESANVGNFFKVVLDVLVGVFFLVKNMAKGTIYLLRMGVAIITLIRESIVLLLDFIPFAIYLLRFFLSTFTISTYNLLGNYSNASNMSLNEYLNWYNNLSN